MKINPDEFPGWDEYLTDDPIEHRESWLIIWFTVVAVVGFTTAAILLGKYIIGN